MKRRVLYIATSDIHIKAFHIPYLKWLHELGCEVHLAAENRGNIDIPYIDHFYNYPFPRTPFNYLNFTTYKALKSLIELNKYDLVHCHTPIPSVLARLAARNARKKGAKVLYTAHGFHFFKGGPIKNWLVYYPLEWLLSSLTDGIVTINAEDFSYINGRMRHRHSFYIKGIGIDTEKFRTLSPVERLNVRSELGYAANDFILLYVAEFIYRKNHQFIIEAIPRLAECIPGLKIVFAGKGVLLEQMKSYASQLGVEKYIDFLGFLPDVGKHAAIADLGISSSRQEGLGLGLAEEMLCSVPVVATIDRGHKEMIIHGKNGFMYGQGVQTEFISFVKKLYEDVDLRDQMGKESFLTAQIFVIENSLKSMAEIYKQYL